MSKQTSTDKALRSEFAKRIREVMRKDGLTKKAVSDALRIRRQTLWLYLNEKATPGGEIIKRACDKWKLRMSVNGFEFVADAFEARPKMPRTSLPKQERLFDILESLSDENVEAKIVGRVGKSFCLQVRLKNIS